MSTYLLIYAKNAVIWIDIIHSNIDFLFPVVFVRERFPSFSEQNMRNVLSMMIGFAKYQNKNKKDDQSVPKRKYERKKRTQNVDELNHDKSKDEETQNQPEDVQESNHKMGDCSLTDTVVSNSYNQDVNSSDNFRSGVKCEIVNEQSIEVSECLNGDKHVGYEEGNSDTDIEAQCEEVNSD